MSATDVNGLRAEVEAAGFEQFMSQLQNAARLEELRAVLDAGLEPGD